MVKFHILRLSARNLASETAFSWVSVAVSNKIFQEQERTVVKSRTRHTETFQSFAVELRYMLE